MGGGQTVRVDSGRLFVCLFVCLFVWFTWDGPVNEEIPMLLIQATFKGFSRTNSLMSPVVHPKENHLLNF